MAAHDERPERLFHYTTGEGLLGIVESGSIWASQIEFLNDGKEYRHAFELALGDPRVHGGRDLSTDAYAGILELCNPDEFGGPEMFVTSFSAYGDLLSQWRAYGRPGDCYAVGLRFEDVQAVAAAVGGELVPCTYDRDIARDQVQAAMTRFFEAWEQGDLRETYPDERHRAFYLAHRLLSPLGPYLKHPAFAEEDEWRIIVPPRERDDVRHRAGRHSLIPYVELPIASALDQVQVVVGPGAYVNHAMWAASGLVRHAGATGWSVTRAEAPYRDW